MKQQLVHIKNPKDVQQLGQEDLGNLSKEIRALIVEVMSSNSGHLGASLGAVELAVGAHFVFDTSVDSLVWDVGHQAYAHKILTGRKDDFSSIRKKDGLAGFPSRDESEYDDFGTGHSSTSISAVLGMAIAKKLNDDPSTSIAIIGDGSLTGGMAFEGLNHLATEDVNAIVIINDNDMSIDPNVGGLQQHLNNIDPQENLFTNLGLNYHGVFNGNDVEEVVGVLAQEELKKGVHVVHFRTKKGFGYRYSEDGNPTHWHAPGKFEIESGEGKKGSAVYPKKYQEIVGETLAAVMDRNERIVVVTPAMATGSSLKGIEKKYVDRFFDVGIAEQHALTFSAGLATQGKLPVCVIYSTFLQRGYDQLIHDVALQKLPVTLLIDRAGLVGRDGATHHGMFDLSFMNTVPNLTVYAPQNEGQLAGLIVKTGELSDGPVAIRYPRGKGVMLHAVKETSNVTDFEISSKAECKNVVLTIGAVGNKISSTDSFDVMSLIKVKPINMDELHKSLSSYEKVVLVEDGVRQGGVAETIVSALMEKKSTHACEIIALPNEFIPHGGQDELYAEYRMDSDSLIEQCLAFFSLN